MKYFLAENTHTDSRTRHENSRKSADSHSLNVKLVLRFFSALDRDCSAPIVAKIIRGLPVGNIGVKLSSPTFNDMVTNNSSMAHPYPYHKLPAAYGRPFAD
jgi:hypothetical protein